MKNKRENRRKFLNDGLKGALTAGFALGTGAILASDKKKTVKCLTQDGELVEVEISDSAESGAKNVSESELRTWINKKK